MRAYLLARVSTEDQKDALPAQVHRLNDYALKRGYDSELIEFQESAYKGNREEFKAVIKKIQQADSLVAVVFDKIDRYTRDSTSEEVRMLQNLYRSGKIELHFSSDNLTIHKDSPATDIMRLGLGVVLAQYYSDAISDNVKRRIEQKLRDGEWIGKAPFGYKNTELSNGKKWVEIDALPAEAVRTCFKWYASGNHSILSIKHKLVKEFGYNFSKSQIGAILKNPFYYGEMLVKGKLYPHHYDMVISRELFDQGEQVRNQYNQSPKRWVGLPYFYRGLIKCAECGCRITFEKKKQKYIYGHCTQSKGKHNASYVAEEELTKQLMAVFESIAMPEHAHDQVSEALRASHEDKKLKHKETKQMLNSEIEKYQNRIEKIYEDHLDDLIPKELYERKFHEFTKKQKSLRNKLENIEQVQEDYYGTVLHLLSLSKDAPKLFINGNQEKKRALINLVLSNLELKGKQLLWEIKRPFDLMAFCNQNQNWLPESDSNRQPWR